MADRSSWSLRGGLAAAVVLAGVLSSVPPAPAAEAPTAVTDPASLVNDPRADVSAYDVQGETASTVAQGNVVVAYTGPSDYGRGVGWAVSGDGGRSFVDRGHLPQTHPGVHGSVALATDTATGVAYLATPTLSVEDVRVFRSEDGGRSFVDPVVATVDVRGYTDLPSIAVDNSPGSCRGNVYLAFARYGARASELVLRRSVDGGTTWGPEGGFLIDAVGASAARESAVVVTPDHRVHVVYWAYVPNHGSSTVMRTSRDCGVTFSQPRMVAAVPQPEPGEAAAPWPFAANVGPAVAVSPTTGVIAVARGVNPPGDDRASVELVSSSDGGATWSAPTALGSDPTGADQLLPALAFSPDGRRLMASWYDRRNDPGLGWLQRYGQLGTVAGGTVRLGEDFALGAAFPAVAALSAVGYESIAATDTAFVPTWTDARDGNAFHARQPDVRFAHVPTRAPTDLALALSGPSAPIVQGEEAAVSATVTNQGTGPAEVVHLNVRLTGGLRGSSSVAPPGAACSGTRVVTCRLGRIPGGRSVTVTIRVAGVTPGTGTATATLTAATGDPDPVDDAAAVDVTTEAGPTAVHEASDDTLRFVDNFRTVEVPLAFDGPGRVLDADVSVRIRHSYDHDVVIRLVSPEGTTVLLAAYVGGEGNDFGTGELSCAGSPTTFDDSADQPITAGTPPFDGTYRPVEPLSAVVGDTVAGTWRVQVSDIEHQDTGHVGCVRLRLVATP